jgi:DNA-binding MarR family transcriptional regulator
MQLRPVPESGRLEVSEPEQLVDAVLGASRALVAVAARSLADLAEDVTLPQYRVLVELASRGPQRSADLGEALGVERSTAGRMCDRRVRKGLVQRRRETGDRRAVRISVTAAGRALVDAVTRRRRSEIAGELPCLHVGRHIRFTKRLVEQWLAHQR